jgi:hypothetical protein
MIFFLHCLLKQVLWASAIFMLEIKILCSSEFLSAFSKPCAKKLIESGTEIGMILSKAIVAFVLRDV